MSDELQLYVRLFTRLTGGGQEEGNPPRLLIHVPAVLEPGKPQARASEADRAATSRAPPLCRATRKGLRTPGTTTQRRWPSLGMLCCCTLHQP